jgi:hypothetical protein
MEESHLAAYPAGPRRLLLVGLAIATYAAFAATARPLTDPSTLTVLVPGLAVAGYGVRRTPYRLIHTTRATTATWVGLALALCAWELVAYYWGNDQAHPTLSLLADPVLDTYPGRVAAYVAWLGTGAWLVTR